jgi:glutamyl-tRNA synthetase
VDEAWMHDTRPDVTRLAPSPTGALHLGNARTFLVNWALARREGWRIVLRIEDLVGPRIKPGAAAATIDILGWMGMDWDEGPFTQSDDLEPYRAAMEKLARGGLVYPSALTRSQVEAASSAPQEGVVEAIFPVALRPPLEARGFTERGETGEGTNWRFAVPEGLVRFDDGFVGQQVIDPSATIGDFIVWTKLFQPAYQLAVVVDDHRQGVTRVVRGNDLLDSAARQLLLYRALGYAPEPAYTHLPLVRGTDGKRLAKRHGDSRIEFYRARGVPRERVIGLLGAWSGIGERQRPRPMTVEEFVGALRLDSIPPDDVVFTSEDHAWLLNRR